MDPDTTSIYLDFEAEGEPEIRRKLVVGGIYSATKTAHAKAWLAEKEHQRLLDFSRHSESISLEQNQTARSAKNAAWIAAIAAMIAAISAIIMVSR